MCIYQAIPWQCGTGRVALECSIEAQLSSKLEFAIGNVYPQQHLEHDLWHCRTRQAKQQMRVSRQRLELLLRCLMQGMYVRHSLSVRSVGNWHIQRCADMTCSQPTSSCLAVSIEQGHGRSVKCWLLAVASLSTCHRSAAQRKTWYMPSLSNVYQFELWTLLKNMSDSRGKHLAGPIRFASKTKWLASLWGMTINLPIVQTPSWPKRPSDK